MPMIDLFANMWYNTFHEVIDASQGGGISTACERIDNMAKYEKDSLGDRMKAYENEPKGYLDESKPIVIRLDMRAGHSFCKKFERPFDMVFALAMQGAAEKLAEEVPGCRLVYFQSDEISFVLNSENDKGDYHCLFDGAVEKLVSVTASIATLGFNKTFAAIVEAYKRKGIDVSVYEPKMWNAQFDSRAFNLPNAEEVRNYLMWRIMDARRNSVSMIGRSVFSQKELMNKNTNEVSEMLGAAGHPLSDYPKRCRLGMFVLRYAYDKESVNPKTGESVTVERHGWKPFDFDLEDVTFDWVEKVYAGGYMRWKPAGSEFS